MTETYDQVPAPSVTYSENDKNYSRNILTDTQKLLIEQRIANKKPSTGAAYLLLIFFGAFGFHRFYLGKIGTGIAILILSCTVIGLLVSGIWIIVDLFLIPSLIEEKTDALRQRLTLEMLASSH